MRQSSSHQFCRNARDCRPSNSQRWKFILHLMICKRKYCYLNCLACTHVVCTSCFNRCCCCCCCCWYSCFVLKLWKPDSNWASRIGFDFIRLFFSLLICLVCLCSVHSTGVCYCFWWVLVCNWIAFTTSLSTIISNRRANICCYPIKNPTLTLVDVRPSTGFIFNLTTCSFVYQRAHVSYRLAGAIFIAACYYT